MTIPTAAIAAWVRENSRTLAYRTDVDIIRAWEEYRERLVDVIDTPNYCRRCTPAGRGCCTCDIACNE